MAAAVPAGADLGRALRVVLADHEGWSEGLRARIARDGLVPLLRGLQLGAVGVDAAVRGPRRSRRRRRKAPAALRGGARPRDLGGGPGREPDERHRALRARQPGSLEHGPEALADQPADTDRAERRAEAGHLRPVPRRLRPPRRARALLPLRQQAISTPARAARLRRLARVAQPLLRQRREHRRGGQHGLPQPAAQNPWPDIGGQPAGPQADPGQPRLADPEGPGLPLRSHRHRRGDLGRAQPTHLARGDAGQLHEPVAGRPHGPEESRGLARLQPDRRGRAFPRHNPLAVRLPERGAVAARPEVRALPHPDAARPVHLRRARRERHLP